MIQYSYKFINKLTFFSKFWDIYLFYIKTKTASHLNRIHNEKSAVISTYKVRVLYQIIKLNRFLKITHVQ